MRLPGRSKRNWGCLRSFSYFDRLEVGLARFHHGHEPIRSKLETAGKARL